MENIGGLSQIEYAFIKDIQGFPLIDGNKLLGDIFFNPFSGFETIPFTEGSMFIKSNSDREDNGPFSKVEVIGIYPSDEIAIDTLLSSLAENKFFLRVTSFNGVKKLIGLPNRPVIVQSDYSSGAKPENLNAFTFSFRCESERPWYFF